MLLNAPMGNGKAVKGMRKLRLTLNSLLNDLRTVTPFLVGAYWLLILLVVGYWVISTTSG